MWMGLDEFEGAGVAVLAVAVPVGTAAVMAGAVLTGLPRGVSGGAACPWILATGVFAWVFGTKRDERLVDHGLEGVNVRECEVERSRWHVGGGRGVRSRLAKATYRGLLLEEVDYGIADRGGVVLIYAVGREVMH